MSQLIGASGSMPTQTYVQPTVTLGASRNGNMLAQGNYLGPGPSSVNAEDIARHRPTSYVLPRQIELMQGFFNMGSYTSTSHPSENTTSAMVLEPATIPHGYGFTASGPVAHGQEGQGGAYGLTFQAPVTPANCLQHEGCQLNNSGGCHCSSGPFHQPHGTSTYY
ncbi:MAG: hypothetical protein K0U52_00665 [Gammaproteobacteria bacterium]|nr:hypothetical protein [Gammaproteobacteria bacterium]